MSEPPAVDVFQFLADSRVVTSSIPESLSRQDVPFHFLLIYLFFRKNTNSGRIIPSDKKRHIPSFFQEEAGKTFTENSINYTVFDIAKKIILLYNLETKTGIIHQQRKRCSTMSSRKTILLALGWHFEALMRGVVDYARENNWHLVLLRGGNTEEGLKRWRGDGIITSLPEEVLTCRSWKGIRIVSLIPFKWAGIRCSVVRENDYEIGRIAAEYFLRQGHTNFAVYSDTRRMNGFRETLEKYHFHCSDLRPGDWIWRKESRVLHWLNSLPKPCALLCENDWDAAEILNIANWNNIPVPSALSILGVGNDELICHAPAVTLSSIDSRFYELGRRAGEELDALLAGKMESSEMIYVDPDPIVRERESSDFTATDNPKLISIMNYLKENSSSPIQIEKLAQKFYLSESSLYKLFMGNLKRSPKQFLLELRLKQACNLLNTGNLTMEEIAGRAGFPTLCAFFTAFRKKFNVSPGEWRKNRKWPDRKET